MTQTVEYCLGNVDAETRRRLRALGTDERHCERSTDDLIEKRCLRRCGDCYREPFLVIDGTPVTGATHADILPALTTENR